MRYLHTSSIISISVIHELLDFQMVRTKQTTKRFSLKALKAQKDAVNRDHPGSIISFRDIERIRDVNAFPSSWIV